MATVAVMVGGALNNALAMIDNDMTQQLNKYKQPKQLDQRK